MSRRLIIGLTMYPAYSNSNVQFLQEAIPTVSFPLSSTSALGPTVGPSLLSMHGAEHVESLSSHVLDDHVNPQCQRRVVYEQVHSRLVSVRTNWWVHSREEGHLVAGSELQWLLPDAETRCHSVHLSSGWSPRPRTVVVPTTRGSMHKFNLDLPLVASLGGHANEA